LELQTEFSTRRTGLPQVSIAPWRPNKAKP